MTEIAFANHVIRMVLSGLVQFAIERHRLKSRLTAFHIHQAKNLLLEAAILSNGLRGGLRGYSCGPGRLSAPPLSVSRSDRTSCNTDNRSDRDDGKKFHRSVYNGNCFQFP